MGFASRLAALNGVNLATLLREMRVPHLEVDRGNENAVRDVAALGGLNIEKTEALIRYTPRRLAEDRAYVLGSERLDTGSVHRTHFRYCPHCVREDLERFDGPMAARPWLRVEWLIDHIRTCLRHDVVLLDAGTVCKRFQAPDFAETMGDQILPRIDDLIEGAIPSPHSGFEDWVVARIDGVRQSMTWLDEMPLRVGIAFCEALGVSSLHPPKIRTGSFSVTDWKNAAAEGFRIAARGEDAIVECLTRLVDAQVVERGVIGLRDTYGYLYGLLQRKAGDPDFEKALDILRRHAFDTLPLEAGTNVLGVVLERRRVHTVVSASRASGAHARTIRNLLGRKGVAAANFGSGLTDHRVTIRAEEVEPTLAKLPTALTAPRVVELTGIPRMHLRSMIAQGFLPTLTASDKVAHARHHLAPEDVDALMKRLFAGAEPVKAPTSRKVTIMTARQIATAHNDDLIAWLLEGKLGWKGRLGEEMRYENLLIDADELTELVRAEPEMTGLTNEHVVRFIPGLAKPSVPALVALGVLATAEEFSPEARRLVQVVTRESAEAFRARYAALGELCQITGLHHKRVRQRLRRVGVDEIFPYEEAGAFIYARQSALEAMNA